MDHPELKQTEIFKKAGELWKALSDAEKKVYADQAAADAPPAVRYRARFFLPYETNCPPLTLRRKGWPGGRCRRRRRRGGGGRG